MFELDFGTSQDRFQQEVMVLDIMLLKWSLVASRRVIDLQDSLFSIILLLLLLN